MSFPDYGVLHRFGAANYSFKVQPPSLLDNGEKVAVFMGLQWPLGTQKEGIG